MRRPGWVSKYRPTQRNRGWRSVLENIAWFLTPRSLRSCCNPSSINVVLSLKHIYLSYCVCCQNRNKWTSWQKHPSLLQQHMSTLCCFLHLATWATVTAEGSGERREGAVLGIEGKGREVPANSTWREALVCGATSASPSTEAKPWEAALKGMWRTHGLLTDVVCQWALCFVQQTNGFSVLLLCLHGCLLSYVWGPLRGTTSQGQ